MSDAMDNSYEDGGDAGGQAAGSRDPLSTYRQVFEENDGLELALRESLGVGGTDSELAEALAGAESFLEQHGTDDDHAFLQASGLGNDPAVVSFLYRMHRTFSTMERDLEFLESENTRLRQLLDEPQTLRALPSGNPKSPARAVTNDELEDEISQIWSEHSGALTNPGHPRHEMLSRRLARLQRARYDRGG